MQELLMSQEDWQVPTATNSLYDLGPQFPYLYIEGWWLQLDDFLCFFHHCNTMFMSNKSQTALKASVLEVDWTMDHSMG